jgi:hypothetical protein
MMAEMKEAAEMAGAFVMAMGGVAGAMAYIWYADAMTEKAATAIESFFAKMSAKFDGKTHGEVVAFFGEAADA